MAAAERAKEDGMGTILPFTTPVCRNQPTRPAASGSAEAEIIIFPGIRIEHYDDEPTTSCGRQKAAVRIRKQPRKRR